jgi:hypothetical protein
MGEKVKAHQSRRRVVSGKATVTSQAHTTVMSQPATTTTSAATIGMGAQNFRRVVVVRVAV